MAGQSNMIGRPPQLIAGPTDRRFARRLLTLALLTSPVIAILFVGYFQSRPNTAAVAAEGPFNNERAFAALKRLVAFGPRPSGSAALERSREFITGQLRAADISVSDDSFIATTPIGPIPMTNIIAKIPGPGPSIVVVGGHYDTKGMTTCFVGANDGGSSAAFLLEMARALARRRNKLTYWLVFFDGEEAVEYWSAADSLYGSRHFATELAAQGIQGRIKAVIVVDMIADAHLEIHREAHSTPWLTDIVFNEAHRLGYGRYFLDRPRTIEDDHHPFLQLGIPAVDIIDLDYGPLNLYWHSPFDTVDKCSPASLGVVGTVLLDTFPVLESKCNEVGSVSIISKTHIDGNCPSLSAGFREFHRNRTSTECGWSGAFPPVAPKTTNRCVASPWSFVTQDEACLATYR
jgi:glutaminyl-peptide cyclotransferase